MKYILPFLGLALILIISTCKKAGTFDGPKIYQVVDFRGGQTYTFTYNTTGSVATIENNVGSDTIYNYNGDTAYELIRAGNLDIAGGYEYIENSSGLADTAWGTYQDNAYSYSYAYDGNNMLTQQKTYVNKRLLTTVSYTNSGKNIFEMVTTNASNNSSTYDYFTFFSSNSNSVGVQNQGKYELGTSINNPIQSDVNLRGTADTAYTINYRYAYDGSGRIDTMVSRKTLYGAITSSLLDSMAFSYY